MLTDGQSAEDQPAEDQATEDQAAAQAAESERVRRHAGNLDAIRLLLGEVRTACRQIGREQSAFGPVCGEILVALGERPARQEELLTYVEDSLHIMVEGWHRVADGSQELKTLIHRDGDPVTGDGTPIIDEPDYSLSRHMDGVNDQVRGREWVEPQLAAAPVAEFAAPVDDRIAALRFGGLHCALTCVDPLRQMLDDLTGGPDIVAAHAAQWISAGSDLHQLSAFLRQSLDHDLPRRDRQDLRSYRALMAYNVEGIIGLAEISNTVGIITKAAGDLILLTRDIIRGLIGDLFARVIVWISERAAVVHLHVTAARLAVVVSVAWRIHAYITALTDSITTLSRSVAD